MPEDQEEEHDVIMRKEDDFYSALQPPPCVYQPPSPCHNPDNENTNFRIFQLEEAKNEYKEYMQQLSAFVPNTASAVGPIVNSKHTMLVLSEIKEEPTMEARQSIQP